MFCWWFVRNVYFIYIDLFVLHSHSMVFFLFISHTSILLVRFVWQIHLSIIIKYVEKNTHRTNQREKSIVWHCQNWIGYFIIIIWVSNDWLAVMCTHSNIFLEEKKNVFAHIFPTPFPSFTSIFFELIFININ